MENLAIGIEAYIKKMQSARLKKEYKASEKEAAAALEKTPAKID